MVYCAEGGSESMSTTDEERYGLVLSDDEVCTLALWGVEVERRYERPMDADPIVTGVAVGSGIVVARAFHVAALERA